MFSTRIHAVQNLRNGLLARRDAFGKALGLGHFFVLATDNGWEVLFEWSVAERVPDSRVPTVGMGWPQDEDTIQDKTIL